MTRDLRWSDVRRHVQQRRPEEAKGGTRIVAFWVVLPGALLILTHLAVALWKGWI